MGTRIINQYACLNLDANCTHYGYHCSYSGKSCNLNSDPLDCKLELGDGICVQMCESWSGSVTRECRQTGTQTVACSGAPTCAFQGSIKTCSGGGSVGGSCTESTSQLTYDCWLYSAETPPPGGGGSCYGGANPECRSGIANCGVIGKVDGSGSCPNSGERCCVEMSGPTCKGTATSCWDDATCQNLCGGDLCCTSTDGVTYGHCDRGDSEAIINARCGGIANYCGQPYVCNGTRYCPNTQAVKVEAAPPGMSPIDKAIVKPTRTCGSACTNSIDCGSHWVEATLDRGGGSAAKYNRLDFDGVVSASQGMQAETDLVIGKTKGWVSGVSDRYIGGHVYVANKEHTAFWVPTTDASIRWILSKLTNSSYVRLAVDGTDYSGGLVNLNAQDFPPSSYNNRVPVSTGKKKPFTCFSGVCRLQDNTADPTCTDAAGVGTQTSVLLSWNPGVYARFNLEVYPEGTSCADARAFCGRVVRPNYLLVPAPGVSVYRWRVSVVNDMCVAYEVKPVDGAWSDLYTLYLDINVDVPGVVREDADGTASLVAGVCTAASSTAYTGGGTVKIAKGAREKTASVSLTDGTFTIPQVLADSAYSLSLTPTDATYTCSCPAGCVYGGLTIPDSTTRPFFVTRVADPWYQTVGGDVAAFLPGSGMSVYDPIPQSTCEAPGCLAYLSLPLVAGDDNTSGSLQALASTQVDLKNTTTGSQTDNVSAVSRFVGLSAPFPIKENYSYFYRLYSMGSDPVDDFTQGGQSPDAAHKPNSAPLGGKSAYFRNGDLTIDSPWTVSQADSFVIFVRGNLTIKSTVRVPVGAGSHKPFLAFIVGGNIYIDGTVGTASLTETTNAQVQGFYLADGQLIVLSVGVSGTEKKFLGEGIFAALAGVRVERDYRNGGSGVENNTYPVALFTYRPDMIDNVPSMMKSSTTQWNEINP